MPETLPTIDALGQAQRLRASADAIRAAAPECRAKVSVLHQLGLLVAQLEGVQPRPCRQCGGRFGFGADEIRDAVEKGRPLSNYCPRCRRERRG